MTNPMDKAPPGVREPSRRRIVNTVTGEDVTFEKYGYETEGRFTQAVVTCQPGGGPPLHYHRIQTERFTAIEGDATIRLGNEPERAVLIGETIEVLPGTLHRFSAGEKPSKFRVEFIPASEDFEKSLCVLFGLARDGLVDTEGLPKSMVNMALVGSMGGIFLLERRGCC